jgi:uncharacterized surface protein with fasciclin (FAS1) repeats
MDNRTNPLGIILAVVIVALLAFGGWWLLMRDTNDDEATDTTGTQQQVDEEEAAPQENIMEIARGNPEFSTLVTAIEAADLEDTLSGEGPFTVFAPTNDAFDALPEGTLNAVLADRELLTSILTYHVVSGEVPASEVVELTQATTVNGETVTVRTENGTVFINDARVTTTDIQASNGVIHVIDAVLLPPEEQ